MLAHKIPNYQEQQAVAEGVVYKRALGAGVLEVHIAGIHLQSQAHYKATKASVTVRTANTMHRNDQKRVRASRTATKSGRSRQEMQEIAGA